MLYRKISKYIESHLTSGSDKILLIEGARQVGKSFIVRNVCKATFKNYVEINFVADDEGPRLFRNLRTTEELYFALSSVEGRKLGTYNDTIIFLDEIQHYPQYLTMLKFLREEHRFHFIASGSMLGITLRSTTSIPVGSIIRHSMYQLDFEEFAMACGMGEDAMARIKDAWHRRESLSPEMHDRMMSLFKRYLLVGGMPDVVNEYIASHNIVKVRRLQNAIHTLYKDDASKYADASDKELAVRRIYDMIPSQMENKKKRIVAKDIRGVDGDRFTRYQTEFEYLVSSGIAIDVHAISNPRFPLAESVSKNLLKLYLNDVGMLTAQLYANNIQAVTDDVRSVNLGAVYESVVAQELLAHGHRLFYYDNRKNGEVDFLIDDYSQVSVLPIEVKSGKDYTVHSALTRLIACSDYHIKEGVVLCNSREVRADGNITYMPIYYIMFFDTSSSSADIYF